MAKDPDRPVPGILRITVGTLKGGRDCDDRDGAEYPAVGGKITKPTEGPSGLDTAGDTGCVSGRRLYPGSVIDLQAAAPVPGTGVLHGQVITRRWIVDLILDLAGYTADRDLAVRSDAKHPLPKKG